MGIDNKIINVIFDLGNVLVDFKPEEYLERLYNDKLIIEQLYSTIFNSKYWLSLDEGSIGLKEAVFEMCLENQHISEYITNIMDNYVDMFTQIKENVAILCILRKMGYSTYYLSNFHKPAFEDIACRYDFFKCFKGGVVSSIVKLLKPGKKIYYELIDKYELIPQRSVFIDDTLCNINTAKEIGFKTIHLGESDRLDVKLKDFGIIIHNN